MKAIILIIIIIILGVGFYFYKTKIITPQLLKNMNQENETEIFPEVLEGISITTIYDNYSVDSRLTADHGFSALISFKDQNILFDTGSNPDILLSNIAKMAINPEKIDFVFISHLHNDHTGGLSGILNLKPDLTVYKPESFFSPTQIQNGIWTTGQLGGEIQEQSLIIDSDKGLIIITGCAHPGIVSIIKKAKEFINKNVYLVLGGFHLRNFSNAQLKEVIKDFQGLGVQKVAPCHCSGDRCRELFKQEYQDDFIENGVGKIINL